MKIKKTKYYKVNIRRGEVEDREYKRAKDIKKDSMDIIAVSGYDMLECGAFVHLEFASERV